MSESVLNHDRRLDPRKRVKNEEQEINPFRLWREKVIKKQVFIYTIGYGNRQPEIFYQLLVDNAITLLIDVRIYPRGWHSAYSRFALQNNLEKIEIEYIWEQSLGNKFKNDNEEGLERFKEYIENDFNNLLFKFRDLAKQYNICFMCSELKHDSCHRSIIANLLQEKFNFKIIHL